MAKPANTTNTFDPETVSALLGKIDGFNADLDSERGQSMSRCRNIRESISNVYKEGKAQGVPEKELRTLVKIRKNEATNAKLYQELEADQQVTLAMLAATEAVADLPLWRASSGTRPDDTGAMKHAKPMFN